jgi:hypothetical protein
VAIVLPSEYLARRAVWQEQCDERHARAADR